MSLWTSIHHHQILRMTTNGSYSPRQSAVPLHARPAATRPKESVKAPYEKFWYMYRSMYRQISRRAKGRKFTWFWFSVRIQTVKAWPIDPFAQYRLITSCSGQFCTNILQWQRTSQIKITFKEMAQLYKMFLVNSPLLHTARCGVICLVITGSGNPGLAYHLIGMIISDG